MAQMTPVLTEPGPVTLDHEGQSATSTGVVDRVYRFMRENP